MTFDCQLFFKSFFSLVVFQLRSGCLSDLIRITNDLLFVNNFFQLILLIYQHQLTVLKLRLRYNIICRAVRQLLFSILFRNSFSHLAHVIIYQLNPLRSIIFYGFFQFLQTRLIALDPAFIVRI